MALCDGSLYVPASHTPAVNGDPSFDIQARLKYARTKGFTEETLAVAKYRVER